MSGITVRANSGLWYWLAALVLVATYIGAFHAWRALVGGIGEGRADLLPVGLTVIIALGLMALALKLGAIGRKVRLRPVAIGIGIAIAALLLSDPAFPAKRIHVLEYALLGLVVGRAISTAFGGRWLVPAAALATAVLGSHDELIQGLLADRTFGLRDLGVDAVGGLAGVLVGDGLALFGPRDRPEETAGALRPAAWLGFAILALGWLALVVAMPGLTDRAIPLWPVVPVAAGGLAWQIGVADAPPTGMRRAAGAIALLMLATVIEPVLAHALPLAFH